MQALKVEETISQGQGGRKNRRKNKKSNKVAAGQPMTAAFK